MQIIDYSIGLIGFSTLNYWARNADQALIGRFLGVGPLGIYAFAYRIMMMPLSQITVTAHTVALPYMAPHQDDHTKLQQAMKIVTTVVGLLVTLPMCWLWLERDFAVTLMLGESWLPVADLLMLFCPLAVLQTLVNPIGLCFHVTGASSKLFQLGLVNTSVMMVGFISGIILGSIREVAACYLVANLLMAPVMVGFGMRLISGSFLQWLRWSLPFLATVAICFGIGRMRQISESSSLNAAETLLLVVFAAAPFYAIAIRRLGSIRLSESIRRKQFVSPDT